MSKRTNTATHEYIVNAPLPEATDTYTVIPHGKIINKVRETLEAKGFEIERELYRCNQNAQIAQGIYHLKYSEDPDMGLMFSWSNSYNKTMRFKCSIGGYVHVSLASIVAGNMGRFGRKHTGTADEEVYETIEDQINNAEQYFNELIEDKELMKNIVAPEVLRAEFMGRAFYVNELINTEQLGIIKSEFRKPSFEYSGVKDSLWEMYNGIIYALQKSHPRTWMDQQRMLHYLICKDFNITKPIVVKTDDDVLPGQLNLLDAIAEAEAESTEIKVVEEEYPEYPFKDDSDIVVTIERPVEKSVEVLPGLSLDEIVRQYPVTKEEAYDAPIEAEVLVDDGGWPCMKCGEMQAADAVFYDGQLCSKCYGH